MASRSGAHRPHGWAELPGDVLRLVASDAVELAPPGPQGFWGYQPLEHPPLLLADVLAAAGTCTAWRRALASPTIASLTIGGARPGKRAWMRRARPGARSLRVYSSAASREGQQLLSSLRGEAVHEAEVARVPACLPDPALLPSLSSLTLSCLEWDAGWAERLVQLPRLARLQALVARPAAADWHEGQAMVLPALPALKSLKAYLEPGTPPLRLEMDRLPALEELELVGRSPEPSSSEELQGEEEDRGSAELVASSASSTAGGTSAAGTGAGAGAAAAAPRSPPCRLRRLKLDLSRARLDSFVVPALESAALWGSELDGAEGLGAATGLRSLKLGSGSSMGWSRTHQCALDKPWLETALAAAPPALRALCLRGTCWGARAAAAVAGLTSLEVLSVEIDVDDPDIFFGEEEDGVEEPPNLGPGPLWPALRALRWRSWQPLPEGLASAARLELLDWVGAYPPADASESIRLLAGLPSLRRLLVCTRGSPPAELKEGLQAALPGLQSLKVDSMVGYRSEAAFLRAAGAAAAAGPGADGGAGSDSE